MSPIRVVIRFLPRWATHPALSPTPLEVRSCPCLVVPRPAVPDEPDHPPVPTRRRATLRSRYLVAALRSGWVAPAGPDLDAFEREIAERVGTGAAVAVSSGTAALHLALLALGVGARRRGARADADVRGHRQRDRLHRRASRSSSTATRRPATSTSALLRRAAATAARARVDGSARSCRSTCSAAAPTTTALAAGLRRRPACPWSRTPPRRSARPTGGRPAGSFGARRRALLQRQQDHDHLGRRHAASPTTPALARPGPLPVHPGPRSRSPHYEHTEIGYNYRLSNLLAALGRAQLRRLDEMIAPPPRSCATATPSCSPPVAGRPAARRRRRRSQLLAHRHRRRPGAVPAGEPTTWPPTWPSGDIETRPVWKPMHLQPVYAGAESLLTGAAERLFADGLTLPSGSALTEPQIARVFDAIDEFLARPLGRVHGVTDRTGGGRLRRARPGGAHHRPSDERGRSAGRSGNCSGVVDDRPTEENLKRLQRLDVPYLGDVAWLRMRPRPPGTSSGSAIRRSAAPSAAGSTGTTFPPRASSTRTPPSGRTPSTGRGSSLLPEPASPRTSPSAGTCISTRTPPSAMTADLPTTSRSTRSPPSPVTATWPTGVLVGTTAAVLQGLRIGRDSTVGAGACVVRDVPDQVTVKGVPAR